MGSSLFVFLLSSLLLFQVSSRAVNISTSWTLPQEGFPHFFRYFQHTATWDDAKAVCSSFNAELFTVETDERRDAARAYLKELDVLNNVWCGLERVNNQAPFVWTGGGQGPVVGDAFWQEAHPLDPKRLCVAIEPLQDYRWQSYPCSGPQMTSFVCQLQVPDWATGPEGCLVNSLPSLTVTYLSETDIIELLSDCGLSGTKRIACKGGENQEDLIKRLSCEPLEDNHLFTRDWSTKAVRKWDTSTPSNSISGYTYQMTHSSNTRHKRESGATSPSTDILLQTEASQPLNNSPDKTTKVPNLQTDSPLQKTTAAEVLSVKEAIKEEITGIPAVFQTTNESPLVRGSTHQLTVKNWLQTLDTQLASTINTILPIIQVTTSEAITSSTRVIQEVTTQTTIKTNLEQTTSQPRIKDLPPTLIQQKMYKKVIEKTIDADEDRKEVINQVLDSNSGDTEIIQIKEDIESLVEGKPNFEKVLLKENFGEKKIKDWNKKPTSTSSPLQFTRPEIKTKSASSAPIKEEKQLEKIFVETSTNSFLKINPTSNEPIKIIPPKLIIAVPTFDRPNSEVTSKVSSEVSTEKKTTSEHKNTEAPIPTTVKISGIEEIESKKVMDILSLKPLEPTKTSPIEQLKSKEEFKMSTIPDIKVSTNAPIRVTSAKLALEEAKTKKIFESLQTSTMTPKTTTIQNIPSSPLTSTYWPKIEPPSSTRTISTNQPILKHSKPAEMVPFKTVTDNFGTSTIKSLRQEEVPKDIIISSISPIQGSTFHLPKITTSPLTIQTSTPKIMTLKPVEINVAGIQLKTTTFPPEDLSTLKGVHKTEDNHEVLELLPAVHVEESVTERQIHPDVEIISHDLIKPIVLMKTVQEENDKQDNLNEDESATELAFSDESSEEAENPKRTARGRLFPHSNPLSFYPYFLNRVLG